jgi:hypothetical protein
MFPKWFNESLPSMPQNPTTRKKLVDPLQGMRYVRTRRGVRYYVVTTGHAAIVRQMSDIWASVDRVCRDEQDRLTL